MIKKFYIFENSLYSELNDIGNFEKNEDELTKLIDYDPKKYQLLPYHDSFILSFKESYITKELGLYGETFTNILNIISYGYNYEVDTYEINYIDRYFNEEASLLFKKILKLLDINIDFYYNSEKIGDVFLTLEYPESPICVNDILTEISIAQESTIVWNAKNILKQLPIEISSSYASSYDIDFDFEPEKIGKYIEEHKLENINTVREFLDGVDFSALDSQEIENISEIENYCEKETDYTDTEKEITKQLSELLLLLDDDDDEKSSIYDDPNQLNLFKDEDIDKTNKIYFNPDLFLNLKIDNLKYAKKAGGKLRAWFESYEFQKNYMKEPTLEKYRKLIKENIINPQIEKEYNYLDSQELYNI